MKNQKEDDLRISKITLLLFLVPFLGELWPPNSRYWSGRTKISTLGPLPKNPYLFFGSNTTQARKVQIAKFRCLKSSTNIWRTLATRQTWSAAFTGTVSVRPRIIVCPIKTSFCTRAMRTVYPNFKSGTNQNWSSFKYLSTRNNGFSYRVESWS